MPGDKKAAEFRAQATWMYRIVCLGLLAAVGASGWLGWHFGDWVGLIIGGVIGIVAAGVLWCAATLLWAMSQDGG